MCSFGNRTINLNSDPELMRLNYLDLDMAVSIQNFNNIHSQTQTFLQFETFKWPLF